MSNVCPKCGRAYFAGYYCVQCGSKLTKVKKCSCGEEVMPSWKFCLNCGIALKDNE